MFGENGLIGRSGKWYHCEFQEHIATGLAHKDDAPFVSCHQAEVAFFEAYFTADRTKPTKAQFETLMDWCTEIGERFEDVAIRPEPWIEWVS